MVVEAMVAAPCVLIGMMEAWSAQGGGGRYPSSCGACSARAHKLRTVQVARDAGASVVEVQVVIVDEDVHLRRS